ncbi:MAG TPA: hypothetical protein DDW76_14175 [Cyanobacteria bacterium UBA11369]|nr:hypothetical protein [Cyanobacteria bacterium UBA11371]HBE36711.1 hypothetical protein [Cyanobacteria bacterium UBA11368]HBE49904.1 hypothetical protein [Cyanobacteria bacterium UBA11369]
MLMPPARFANAPTKYTQPTHRDMISVHFSGLGLLAVDLSPRRAKIAGARSEYRDKGDKKDKGR